MKEEEEEETLPLMCLQEEDLAGGRRSAGAGHAFTTRTGVGSAPNSSSVLRHARCPFRMACGQQGGGGCGRGPSHHDPCRNGPDPNPGPIPKPRQTYLGGCRRRGGRPRMRQGGAGHTPNGLGSVATGQRRRGARRRNSPAGGEKKIWGSPSTPQWTLRCMNALSLRSTIPMFP